MRGLEPSSAARDEDDGRGFMGSHYRLGEGAEGESGPTRNRLKELLERMIKKKVEYYT